ncbi:MAG: hypothetical protein U5J83_16080 [Bryobacterales bacterium]|nr:hypothetical protein [Bryobacterales bacterium]
MAGSRRSFVKTAAPLLLAQTSGVAQQAGTGPSGAGNGDAAIPAVIVWRHDQRVEALLGRQITDERDPNAGGYADAWEIVSPQSGSAVVSIFASAFLCEQSRFFHHPELLRRILLASRFLERKQLASGNIDLLTTNFNSPPDTGFVVHNVAPAAILAKRAGESAIVGSLAPFLRKAGAAMAVGGVHTPNHRWVLSSALALIHHWEPRQEYLKRIEQWLAEGIDIDEDGLYTERSPLVYSPVVNRSLIFMAEFLGKPALLDPVRRNLEAALYLMHANGELETALSGRQDQNTVGSMGVNWMGLQYLAERDGNGVFATLARRSEGEFGDLALSMLLPVLQQRSTSEKPPASDYRKVFGNASLHRIRRGKRSVSIFTKGHDRVFSIRNGDAVVEAVRFASAFFGKGQFIPTSFSENENGIEMTQTLSGPYYQPLDAPEFVPADPAAWTRSRLQRRRSEVCEINQRVRVKEFADRFELEFIAEGTPHVPVAIEIGIRQGMVLEHVRTSPASPDTFLSTGELVSIRGMSDSLLVEAPASRHAYTQLRGALPKLPGPALYITGFTPFKEKVVFRTT